MLVDPRPPRWVSAFLLMVPTFAYFTLWISPHPGQAGQWHAYRIVVVVLGLYGLFQLPSANKLGPASRVFLILCLVVAAEAGVWLVVGTGNPQRAGAQASAAVAAAGLTLMVRSELARLVRLCWGVVIGGWLVTLVALRERLTGIHLEDVAGRGWAYRDALGATFLNPNNYAGHVALMAMATLVMLSVNRMRGGLVLSVIITAAGFLTYSRTMLGATIPVVAGFLILERWRGSSARLLKVAAVAMLGAGAAWSAVTSAYAAEMFNGADGSDADRLAVSVEGMKSIIGSAGVGVGPGSFELAAESAPRFGSVVNLHNSLLEVFVAYGLLAGAVLVWCLIRAGQRLVRGISGERYFVGLIGVGALSSAILGGLSASSILGDPAWWLELSLAVLCADLCHSNWAPDA